MLLKLLFSRPKKKPAKVYVANKEEARTLVTDRLTHFNQFYNYKWNRVSIKNTRRRWGSCSRKGNLNFCYKLMFLTPELVDYIVVHELCHLGQFNHSKNFWELVSRTIPDYRFLRKKLMSTSLYKS